MEFFEVINKRRSIRTYENKPVEDEKLQKVLLAAQKAPTSYNNQDIKFIVVKEKNHIEKMMYACKQQEFVKEAPIIIVGCGTNCEHVMTCGQLAYPIDVTIACTHLLLAATDQGLGTCWIGSFYEDKVKKFLQIPEEIKVVCLITLGYSRYQPAETNRKSISDLVCFEKWC